MIDANGILMIEPSSQVTAQPVVDEATRKMSAALRQARPGDSTNGFHLCACGVSSGDTELWIMDGAGQLRLTNSLAVHYLAFHRPEITAAELSKVYALSDGEAEPNAQELRPPSSARAVRVARIPEGLRDWLNRLPDQSNPGWTALDSFANNGLFCVMLARSDLPVPEAELVSFLAVLENVWDPPAGGFRMKLRVRTNLADGGLELKVSAVPLPSW